MNFGFLGCPSDEMPELSYAADLSAIERKMVIVSKDADDLWHMAARADEIGRDAWHDELAEQAKAKETEYADLKRRYGDIEAGEDW